MLLAGSCVAQIPDAPQRQSGSAQKGTLQTTLEQIRNLPAEWLIGPYIPSTRPLRPLANSQRFDVYIHQTYLTAGAYILRLFPAGIDQARGSPYQWGGGMDGFSKRFASRYGTFMISNTLHAVGDAALGYEPRYDFCRCTGFWPRTKHAMVRNFVVYNRSENELRPAIPLYAGSFAAGMISSTWLPRPNDLWRNGAYGAVEQAGFGSAYNWVSEFSIDILRKITKKKYLQPNGLPAGF
jgi:hypothetical protein